MTTTAKDDPTPAAGGDDPATRTTNPERPPRRRGVRRAGALREEPYFASPVFACPSCGYLATVGLPQCPRCFSPLPLPMSSLRIAVRAIQWLVLIGGLSYALGLPWWVQVLALILATVREIRRPRPPSHPAQFG